MFRQTKFLKYTMSTMNTKPTIYNFEKRFSKLPKPKKTLSDMLKKQTKQFCLNTALHGYRFIVLKKRILLERVVWAIICLLSLITALVLLLIAWSDFQQQPTVLVTDSAHFPIWNYQFPAVTVCNFNKISKSKVYSLAKNLTHSSGRTVEEIALDLQLLYQLINNNNPNVPKQNYTRLNKLLKDNKLSVDGTLKMLAPSCNKMFQRCKWKGEEKICDSIFEQIRTLDGFCCSFNYFALKNHTFSGILVQKAPKAPRKVSACGYTTGLEVLIDNQPDDYFASQFPSFGHRVFVHNPHYYPDWSLQNLLVEIKIVGLISVNPTITFSSDSIRRMAVTSRQCLFPDERQLVTFKRYTFHNCMVECRMNLTKRFCRCVPYYYIHKEDSGENICTPEDIPCLAANDAIISSSVVGFNLSTIGSEYSYSSAKSTCKCLPDCEDSNYYSEMSSGELHKDYSTNQVTLFGEYPVVNQSVFRVFYKDLVGMKNRRDVIFNWHTLLAYYGGILGLFIGFSFVSVIEVIYFFTIRLAAEINKNNAPEKKLTMGDRWCPNKKINVQPMAFQSLDPTELMNPAMQKIRKRGNISDPFFYFSK